MLDLIWNPKKCRVHEFENLRLWKGHKFGTQYKAVQRCDAFVDNAGSFVVFSEENKGMQLFKLLQNWLLHLLNSKRLLYSLYKSKQNTRKYLMNNCMIHWNNSKATKSCRLGLIKNKPNCNSNKLKQNNN